ncbi:MAG: OmpA/MotB family protein [Desulfobacterales bacterium]
MRKKNLRSGTKKSEDSAGSRWEIVYSGFVLILLCFFIMLSSFSTMQEAKVMQFVKSFVTAVGIMPRGTKLEPGLVVLSDSPDMVASKSELAKIFHTLEELAYEFNLEKEINLVLTREGLVMRMSEHMLFGLGSADIAPEALPLLQKVGAIISKTAYLIRIEGHTDNLPIHTERYPSNWELSTARAVNVLRYFIKNHNIDPKRLAAEGFSEFHPVVANDTAQNREKNRRVEIIFIKKERPKTSIEEIF